MSRSCQSATSSSAGTTAARTTRASPQRFSLRIGLRLCGIALEPFWPDRERLLGLADLGALPVAHVRREPLDAGRDERERREERRVPIARDDLRRHRLRLEARARASARSSIVGREVRVRARPRRRSCRPRSRRAPPASRARPRAISAWCPASASPKVIGSAKMPWLRPIIGVFACSRARLRERGERARRSARGACRPRRAAGWRGDVSSTSLEVIPRCSQRASIAGQLLDVREEGDDVVLRRALDLVDARRVERRGSCARMRRGRAARDELGLLHRLARGELDLEPARVAARGRPELGELGGRVAGDHAGRVPQVAPEFMPAARPGPLPRSPPDARPVRGGLTPARTPGAPTPLMSRAVVAQEKRDHPGGRRRASTQRAGIDLRASRRGWRACPWCSAGRVDAHAVLEHLGRDGLSERHDGRLRRRVRRRPALVQGCSTAREPTTTMLPSPAGHHRRQRAHAGSGARSRRSRSSWCATLRLADRPAALRARVARRARRPR